MSVRKEAWFEQVATSSEEVRRKIKDYFESEDSRVGREEIAQLVLRYGTNILSDKQKKKLWSSWSQFFADNPQEVKDVVWALTKDIGRVNPYFFRNPGWVPPELAEMEMNRRLKAGLFHDQDMWTMSQRAGKLPNVSYAEVHSAYREPRVTYKYLPNGPGNYGATDIMDIEITHREVPERSNVDGNTVFFITPDSEEETQLQIREVFTPYFGRDDEQYPRTEYNLNKAAEWVHSWLMEDY